VGNNDVVYDLGCGDGRIVISAAKKYGARGVGIDINADRIEEARANARAAGVEGQVSFETKDLFGLVP
jgi:cyclopropane fatty-acyl-phospholipid synthase-like methyltransferase